MADRYAAAGSQDVTITPGDSVLGVVGVTTIRGRIYDMMWGSIGTPADNEVQWLVRRSTDLGTEGSAVVGQPLDDGAPTALTLASTNYSVEPAMAAGSEIIDIGLNQRASWRWVAAPEGEIVMTADAAVAIVITPIGPASVGVVTATAHWVE